MEGVFFSPLSWKLSRFYMEDFAQLFLTCNSRERETRRSHGLVLIISKVYLYFTKFYPAEINS